MDDQAGDASDISDEEMISGIPDDQEEQDEDEGTVPALTMDELRKWQKALLEVCCHPASQVGAPNMSLTKCGSL